MGVGLRSLRQFVLVADCGSISRAAARLGVSQPTLSRSIRNMEATRGVELFERHGEGVSLTRFGQILYSHAVGILNDFDRATEEIKQLQGSGKLSLRIAAGDLWGYVLLPEVIREYSAIHPDVLIDIDIVGHANRLDGLRNGTYDLAFGIIDPKVEALYSLTFLKLRRFGFTIYGDESHPLLGLRKITKGDLARYRWVNHQFEFGLLGHPLEGEERDYAVKANTLLNTIQTIKGSELLISASSGFEPVFRNFGLAAICTDTTGQASDRRGELFRGPSGKALAEAVRRVGEAKARQLIPSTLGIRRTDIGADHPETQPFGLAEARYR